MLFEGACSMNGTKTHGGRALVQWCLITICLTILLAAASFGGASRFLGALELLIGLVALLLLFWALTKANDWTKRGDFFAPAVAFPLGYVIWFVIGSVDFIHVPSSVSLGLFEPIPTYVWFYVVAGLAAYFLGVLLIRASRDPQESKTHCRDVWSRRRFWQIIVALSVAMVVSYSYIVSQIGIPALSQFAGEDRLGMANHGVMQAVLFSSTWTIILFLLTFVWAYPHTKAVGLVCWAGVMVASVLLLSLGGRGQLFVPFLTAFVLRHYIKARFRLAKLVSVLIVVFCFMS